MLQTLSVIGTGGHAAHADKCGVYIDGKKIVGDFGKGINVHILSQELQLLQSQAFDTGRNDEHVCDRLFCLSQGYYIFPNNRQYAY